MIFLDGFFISFIETDPNSDPKHCFWDIRQKTNIVLFAVKSSSPNNNSQQQQQQTKFFLRSVLGQFQMRFKFFFSLHSLHV